MIHSLSGGENEDGNQTNNGNIEKYCYNNDDANCTTYGGLYQWAEAVQYLNGATNTTSPNTPFSGHVRGICPEGWHIPTKAEFQTLQSFVGGSFEGNRLKAVSQGSGDGQGTNTSGFSALLAGIRGSDGGLYASGDGGYTVFCGSTEYGKETADNLALFDEYLGDGYGNLYPFNYPKKWGFSVRCLKD